MKLFFLSTSPTPGSPPWTKVLAANRRAWAECIDLVPIELPGLSTRRRRPLHNFAATRAFKRQMRELIQSALDPEGPNILFAECLSHADFHQVSLLGDMRNAFSHRVLNVSDMRAPDRVPSLASLHFDQIYSFSPSLAKAFGEANDAPFGYRCPGIDALRYATVSSYRPIDAVSVGRRDWFLDGPVARHLMNSGSKRLFVDPSPRSGHQYEPIQEVDILLGTYARSKLSLCFEPSQNPRFKGTSVITERWIHSWCMGCVVVGTSPRDKSCIPMMDWQDSVLELPGDVAGCISVLDEIMADANQLEACRRRNVRECLLRHDIRFRLRDTLDDLGLDAPSRLSDAIAKLHRRADDLGKCGKIDEDAESARQSDVRHAL